MGMQLEWKPDEFGPDAPYIVVTFTSGRWAGTYGVWIATDGAGHARPFGSGRGCTRDEALACAREKNRLGRHGGSPDDR